MAEIEEELDRVKSLLVKYKYVILIIWLLLSVILFIIGVVLLNASNVKIEETEHVIYYSNCQYFDPNDNRSNTTCQEYSKSHQEEPILCYCEFNITVMLKGKVTLYFELPSFDQSLQSYVKSKDNDQLRGILTKPPSPNCSPYQYVNNTTIVPCGAIADSMLLDYSSSLAMTVNNSLLEIGLLRFGMLSAEDKIGFNNPDNLTYALQNFSKPIHWPKNIYEFDLNNEDNNGFQNENFISWMRTDWKRKHYARINQTGQFKEGLPKGAYQFYLNYYRSPRGYIGPRKLILSAVDINEATNSTKGRDGGILLAFGLVMFAAGVIFYYLPSLRMLYSDKIRRSREDHVMQNEEDTSLSASERNNAASPLRASS